jgi:hypothetical protein
MADRHPASGQFTAVGEAAAAHAAGEQASHDRQAHYHQNVQGQGACAGDPMPAESTLTPAPVRPPRIYQQPGEPGQP